MQVIHDALSPERLAQRREMFERENQTEAPERRAADLDRELRAQQDAAAETEDRNRHERRRRAALENDDQKGHERRRRAALGLVGMAALFAFAGCAPKSTVADVVAAEAALAASGRVVLACYAVPACNAAAPKPDIKKAYDSAYDAVTAAQATADAGGTPVMTAASAALATLQDLVAKLPKTGT